MSTLTGLLKDDLHGTAKCLGRSQELTEDFKLTCSCRNGRLKNMWRYLRPKPFLIDDSAYLTWADPSGLQTPNITV